MLQTRVFQPRLRDFHAVNGYLPPRGALRALELGWQRAGSVRIEPSTISGACNRWRCHFGLSATIERDRRFADSLLEGDGFEPSVPLYGELGAGACDATRAAIVKPGTP